MNDNRRSSIMPAFAFVGLLAAVAALPAMAGHIPQAFCPLLLCYSIPRRVLPWGRFEHGTNFWPGTWFVMWVIVGVAFSWLARRLSLARALVAAAATVVAVALAFNLLLTTIGITFERPMWGAP